VVNGLPREQVHVILLNYCIVYDSFSKQIYSQQTTQNRPLEINHAHNKPVHNRPRSHSGVTKGEQGGTSAQGRSILWAPK